MSERAKLEFEGAPCALNQIMSSMFENEAVQDDFKLYRNMRKCAFLTYSKTCVRQPPLKLTLVVDVER